MDDLAGLDWKPDPPASRSSTARYGAFSPAPAIVSGHSTPLSAQQSGNTNTMNASTSKLSSSANDTFSNLLAPKPSKPNGSVSLQERQRQLLEEKSRKDMQTQQQYETDAHYWEGLGSGRGTPAPAPTPSPDPILGGQRPAQQIQSYEEDDILSAFNSSAPVDTSSHYPPPRLKSETQSRNNSPNLPQASQPKMLVESRDFDEDDDPFGLSQFTQKSTSKPIIAPSAVDEDDDILGALGQPVAQKPIESKHAESMQTAKNDNSESTISGHPAEPAVAELVEMGFPPEKAREALEHTDTGTDVQAAVGWLITKAHEESNHRVKPVIDSRSTSQSRSRNEQDSRSRSTIATWAMPQTSQDQMEASRSSSTGEKDVKQYAAELSTTFLKTANSFWKTSQKKVQKAVSDYKQDGGDTTQPKWMREARTLDSSISVDQPMASSESGRSTRSHQADGDVTDEALLLESGRSAPSTRPPRRQQLDARPEISTTEKTRQPSPLSDFESTRRPSPSNLIRPAQPRRPIERISKQAVEDESAQAYVSPARRRKVQPQVEPSSPALDFFSAAPLTAGERKQSVPVRPSSTTINVRPKVSARQFTPVSSASLASSQSHRQRGTEAFKRGDYAEAHTHYSNALAALSDNHPVAIVVRCNRALTNTKVGDPRAAIVDADAALLIVGPSQGEGEKISFGGNEADKDMKEFFGKALMRKAEALEHMEKWSEAAKVWKEAVQAGVGGSVSIQGRNRCEKAAGTSTADGKAKIGPATAAKPAQTKPKPPARSAFNDLNGSMNSGAEAEAVKRLRAANAAAEAASDEAFALSDIVDARLVAWRTGKAENLRALLASLDTVLWPEAGWTKVGMSDLVLPPRVKIIYMKAIAKVHPDKIPPNATTEQRMISGSVFAALNEAWDSFKRDNNL